jgi:arginine deiminase
MREQHDAFASEIEEDGGAEVLYARDCLAEVLQDPQVAREVVEAACAEEQPGVAPALLDTYECSSDGMEAAGRLADALIGGVTIDELAERTGPKFDDLPVLQERVFALEPLANMLFTRDPVAVVGEAALAARPYSPKRVRETTLVTAIFEHHPALEDLPVVAPEHGTLEGGDVLVLNEEAVLIGCSERTSLCAIHDVASKLFEQAQINRIYAVAIPQHRSSIHFDTVLSIVGEGVVVAHEPVIDAVQTIRRLQPSSRSRPVVSSGEERGLMEVIGDELGGAVEVVPTGGTQPKLANTEQRQEGANLLALAPGEVTAYERNRATNAALRDRGVRVHTICGGELLHGLGGPHCLTMPLERTE